MSDIEYKIVVGEPASNRGRKPKEPVSPESLAMDLVKAEVEQKQEALQEALIMIGDGQPFDKHQFLMKAKACFDFSGMLDMAAGKYLLAVKQTVKHGEWLPLLKQYHISPRTAQRGLHLAEKFGKYANLAHLTYTKADLLEEFCEADIEALNNGEEVMGITSDEFEVMPSTELRKKIREYLKRIEAGKNREKALEDVVKEKTEQFRAMEKRFLDETAEEKAQRKLRETIDKGEQGYFETIYLISGYLDQCITLIHQAEAIPGVNGDILEDWMLKYEDVGESIGRLFEEWQDAVTNICPDRPRKEPVS
jgi:hypothetical protein